MSHVFTVGGCVSECIKWQELNGDVLDQLCYYEDLIVVCLWSLQWLQNSSIFSC